jgi:hypothetical protein
MDHVIVSFILLVLAAKAQAQAKDNLTGTKRSKKLEVKRGVAQIRNNSSSPAKLIKLVG